MMGKMGDTPILSIKVSVKKIKGAAPKKKAVTLTVRVKSKSNSSQSNSVAKYQRLLAIMLILCTFSTREHQPQRQPSGTEQ